MDNYNTPLERELAERRRQKTFGWPHCQPGYTPEPHLELCWPQFMYLVTETMPGISPDSDQLAHAHWLWNGETRRDGLMVFNAKGYRWPARKYIWRLIVGPVPTGMIVKPFCSEPGCISPRHLRLEKRGSRRQVLTPKMRADIISLHQGTGASSPISVKELAPLFEVSERYIYQLLRDR